MGTLEELLRLTFDEPGPAGLRPGFLAEEDANGPLDMNFVHADVATGAAPRSVADVKALKAAGITHVIDNRAEAQYWVKNLFKGHGVAYLYNGVKDDGQPKPDGWFERGLEFAKGALDKGGKVYSHCAAGINRGPSMAYAILRMIGHEPDEAETMVRTARPKVFNPMYGAPRGYMDDAERALTALGYTGADAADNPEE